MVGDQWDNFNFIEKVSKLTQDFKKLCIEKYNWNIVENTMLLKRKSVNATVRMGNLGNIKLILLFVWGIYEYYCSYEPNLNTEPVPLPVVD